MRIHLILKDKWSLSATYSYRTALTRHLFLPGFVRPATQTYRFWTLVLVDKGSPATYSYRVVSEPPPIPTESGLWKSSPATYSYRNPPPIPTENWPEPPPIPTESGLWKSPPATYSYRILCDPPLNPTEEGVEMLLSGACWQP